MTEAFCFNCRKVLGIGKPMEELLKDRFPIFCSVRCAGIFPMAHTPDFDVVMRAIEEEVKKELSKNG